MQDKGNVKVGSRAAYKAYTMWYPEIADMMRACLDRGLSINASLAELSISVSSHERWLKEHEAYAIAVENGKNGSQKYWEKIGHDGIVGEIKGFSATAWMFVMKSRFRAQYGDQITLNAAQSLIEVLRANNTNKQLVKSVQAQAAAEAKKQERLDDGIVWDEKS